MKGKLTSERPAFTAYAVALGLGGSALALLSLRRVDAHLPAHAAAVICFALFIGVAWRFPFSILPRTRMSMDFVFIIAALAVLPAPLPYLVGLGAAVLGGVLRRRETVGSLPGVGLPFLNAGVLFVTLGVGSLLASRMGSFWGFARLGWRNTLGVVIMFVSMNLLHMSLLSLATLLRGDSPLEFIRHHLLVISPIEIFTIPLVLSLVSLYVNSGMAAFLCLGVSLLLMSYLFHHLNRVEEGVRRVNQSLSDRTSELAALNSIGKEVSSSLDPAQVCAVVARHCRQVFPSGTFFIATVDAEKREVTARFSHRGDTLQAEDRLPVGAGFVDWTLKTLRPVLIRDLLEEGRNLPFPPITHDPTIRSILMVPLMVENRATGVMGVVEPTEGKFDIDRLSVITTIAQQAAVAIENARHYQLATRDQLTGLFLRHHFLQRLADERTRAQRYRTPFAVLMLDLDTFKEINDRHGHNTGDRFLAETSEAIQRSLRSSDIACRWGGDEFCVLLPQTDLEAARSTAERIRKAIEDLAAPGGVRATASLGVATYPTDFDGSVEDLVKRADQALYRAKGEGKDRVAVYSVKRSEPAPAA
ncbi:MAG TPA: diguanylate cyclase [Candidatus Polarisedimenticolia bacterium]|nr:diguanylate cyclase [Candidatus Polarisedimenticolia bacterium]